MTRMSPDVGRAAHPVRTDIQALRALAVLAVVGFHLWPLALPGGYVGVDIFFVISGFLITGQLLRGRERGTLRLGTFWAARARRLLPLSLLVLAVSVLLTLAWAPDALQWQYLRSIIGSVFYIENWQLAADGVDYLAHGNAPPIAQHYWSLSVEEQFYVLWPLLLLAATAGTAAFAAKRRRFLVATVVVAVVGFGASVWLTAASYPFGYFSTASRLWEFAIGAIVALIPALRIGRSVRIAVWMLAVLGLGASLLLFDDAIAFPGPWAVVPVAATAAFIAVGPTSPSPLFERFVAARPVQWIGDQSYGIYLWHWPPIVIAPHVLGRPTDLPENVAILIMTLLLAAASKRLVEDPIRFRSRFTSARPRAIGGIALSAMLIVGAGAAVPAVIASERSAQQQEAASASLNDPAACRGANALMRSECAPALDEAVAADDILPALAGLYEDTDGAYSCYDQSPGDSAEPVSCTLGSAEDDAERIALVGDSHAAMLIPALRDVAETENWSIDVFVGRGCVWLEPVPGDCSPRNDVMNERLLTGGYDAIITTQRNDPARTDDQRAQLAAAHVAAWNAAESAGVRVIAVADNPAVPQASLDCILHSSSFDASTCDFTVDGSGLANDPLRAAATETTTPLVDLSGAYCADERCSMALGGVIVYRDDHHITATFSHTLAPYLRDAVAEAIG